MNVAVAPSDAAQPAAVQPPLEQLPGDQGPGPAEEEDGAWMGKAAGLPLSYCPKLLLPHSTPLLSGHLNAGANLSPLPLFLLFFN